MIVGFELLRYPYLSLKASTLQGDTNGQSVSLILTLQFSLPEQACFIVRDANGQKLAYLYFED
jgi:hypothetical protein